MLKDKIYWLVKWIFIPISLFLSALGLFILFYFESDINITTRPFKHGSASITQTAEGITGQFTADDNYLSLISITFNPAQSFNSDMVFRIKNTIDKDWYHVATIAASQNFILSQYVFGFPTIILSKNRIYEFNISQANLLSGSLSPEQNKVYPILISQYQFPKNILLSDTKILIDFMVKKLSYYIYTLESWKVFLVYCLPCLLYIFYISIGYKIIHPEILKQIKKHFLLILKPLFFFILIGIFIDIFIIKENSDSTSSFFIILWILGLIAYQLDSRYSFSVAFILLIVCPLLLSADMNQIANKSAVWAYMFLIIGSFQALIELKAEQSFKLRWFLNILNYFFSFVSYVDSFLIVKIKNLKRFALSSALNFIKVALFFIVTPLLIFLGFDLYFRYIGYRDRQMKNPGIPKIEPTFVYPGTKVFLYGERFGDGKNDKYAVMRNGKRVRVDYWEDHKIIFTVPLGWEEGPMDLWIEKPVEWNAEIIIERTKPKSIRLLKVTGHFTPDDDLYFKEKKSWKKETLELNGYNSTK